MRAVRSALTNPATLPPSFRNWARVVGTTGPNHLRGRLSKYTSHVQVTESMTSLPTTDSRRAYFLLAHETFHILSRTDAQLRDHLYAPLGFTTVEGFEYPAELEDRRVSNPDAFEYLHTVTVQAGSQSVDVIPVIQSLLPLNEVIQLPNSSTRWTSFSCPLMPAPAKLSATAMAI